MPLVPTARVAVAAALAVLAAAVSVAAGAGSPPAPLRATAPRLLAHDRSHFAHARDPHGLPPRVRRSRRALQSVSLTRSFAALTGTTTYSNDTGDIGKTQYVQAAGGSYAVYSRLGTLLAAVTDKTFWSGLTGPDAAGLCATAPRSSQMVAYDRAADSWVIAELAYAVDSNSTPIGPLVACVAVSKPGDATSVYNRYVFQVSTSLYADFPALGVWGDGYYLSFDEVTSSGTFLGAGALALERSKMLTGSAAQARYFDLQNVTPRLGGMLPATNMSLAAPSGSEPYLQAHDDPTSINDRLEVWGFHVDWTSPATGSTFQPVQNVPVTAFSSTFSCTKPGTTTTWSDCIGQDLQPGGFASQELNPYAQAYSDLTDALPRLGGRLEYLSSGGVSSLTAALTLNNGSHAGIGWYQLQNNGSGWSMQAQGQYVDSSYDRYLPSAATDGSGDVALAYDLTGAPSYYPTFSFTDPNGGIGDWTILTGQTDHQGDTEWGRSTSAALDPVGLCRFWATGPGTATHTSWATAVGVFSFSGCTPAAAQPPLLTVDPTWTAPLVREALSITGTPATFTSSTVPVGYTYQWRRCDVNGLNCIDIPGATSTSYTMTATDAVGDRTLRFQETATTSDGASVAVSQPTTIVQSTPPANVSLPAISGIFQDGSTLSTTTGTWVSSSPLSYTYRWRRCTSGVCSNISGATSSTYALTSADVGSTVDVVVSATNTGGGTDANAPATTAIQPLTPPANVALPVVTGTPQEGSQLTASSGTWTSMTAIAYAYQWYRCQALACTTIVGATGATYTAVTADVGNGLVVGVTATNNGGSTVAYSAVTSVVVSTPPTNLSAPLMSGTAGSGQTLTTTNGTWSSSSPLTYSYQWRRCTSGTCAAIAGGTSNNYTVQPADVGSTVDLIVGATNTGGTTYANASATAVVTASAPANLSQPAVFGNPQVGTTMSSTNGTWSSAFPITFAYQWRLCSSGVCTDISGATASSYTLASTDVNHTVQLIVTATNLGGATSATSPASPVIAASTTSTGGGGGGGGGGGTPNLVVTGFATPASPLPGDTVTFAVLVDDKNKAPATKLLLTVTLPAGVTYVSGTADRGSGCAATGTSTVVCNLDYLSSDSPQAHVVIYAKVTASGAQNATFAATSDLGDLDSSDNTLTIPLTAAATTSTGVPAGLNGEGTTPTKKTDKQAPTAQAVASTGRRGQTAKLRFKIYDDSGVAKAVATVARNGKSVGTARTGFGSVAYGSVYYVGWQVPRTAPTGRYEFCVVAFDRAQHQSRRTCAPLTLN